jgi:hypothetical protein
MNVFKFIYRNIGSGLIVPHIGSGLNRYKWQFLGTVKARENSLYWGPDPYRISELHICTVSIERVKRYLDVILYKPDPSRNRKENHPATKRVDPKINQVTVRRRKLEVLFWIDSDWFWFKPGTYAYLLQYRIQMKSNAAAGRRTVPWYRKYRTAYRLRMTMLYIHRILSDWVLSNTGMLLKDLNC